MKMLDMMSLLSLAISMSSMVFWGFRWALDDHRDRFAPSTILSSSAMFVSAVALALGGAG